MSFSQLNQSSAALQSAAAWVGQDVLNETLLGQSKSLLFIDSGVDDIQTLVKGAAAGTEVHVLRSGADAINQITQTLLGRTGIESLQIVSHGKSGGVQLGASWLDLQTLPTYVAQLKSWGQALTADADILLYGCDVAQDASGKAFVNLLAQATGADVAASEDLTGNAALGGDWDLEVQTGTIESVLAFDSIAMNSFQSILALSFTTTVNYAVGTQPWGVTVEDFNGDNNLDLAVANRISNTVSILLGNGDGTFLAATDLTITGSPASVKGADFNGDGSKDLVVGTYTSGIAILLGNGSGNFSSPNYFTATGNTLLDVNIGDFNGDNKVDVATANFGSNNASVFLGNGNGTFGVAANLIVGIQPRSVSITDFDGDGKQDLAVANSGASIISIFPGNGDGTFNTTTNSAIAGGTPYYAVTGDFTGDGKVDIATSNYNNGNVSLMLGNGDSTFGSATNSSGSGWSLTTADFNGDGRLDIALADRNASQVSIVLNNGNGTFAAPANFPVGNLPFKVGVGDFNNDGKPDVAITNFSGGNISVLLNTSTNNDAPTINVSGSPVSYTENASPTVLDTGAVVSDTDSGNFDTGNLTVRFSTNGVDTDRLAIRNQRTATNLISLDGRKILYDGTQIGTYTGGIGTENLVITFNANATQPRVEALLQNITYANVSDNPSLAARTVSIVLTDGDGGTSTAVTKTIDLNNSNDAPLIGRRTVLYDGTFTATALPATTAGGLTTNTATTQGWTAQSIHATTGGSPATITTANGLTTLTTNTAIYAGLARQDQVLDANAGFLLNFQADVINETLLASANKNNDGKTDRAVLNLTLVTNDPTKAIELSFTKTGTVTRVFAQEDGTNQINPALEPDTPAIDTTRQLFTQAEGVDVIDPTLGYSLYVKGDLYTLFNGGTAILSGKLRNYTAFNGPIDPYATPNLISFSDNTASAFGSFSLGTISLINGPITNQTVNEDNATAALSFGAFDIEGNAITVTGSSSNTALVNTGNISIAGTGTNQAVTVTPIGNANGTSNITLTANDGSSTNSSFGLTVNSVNDAPTFTKGINQSVIAGSGAQTIPNWATTFNPGGGTDEAAQTAIYEIVSNSNTTLFSVAPAIAVNGTLTYTPGTTTGTATLTVRVKDSGGTANSGIDTSATETFTITVNPQTISLNSTDTTATEVAGDTGTYRITRDASSGDLVVNLAITGTAAITDYSFSNNVTVSGTTASVTIPDGQTFVDIVLTAVDDIQAEAAETIQLDLATGTYTIGANTTGTVTIAQNDFAVTNTNDSGEGSLRQAILNANAIAGADTVTFNGSTFTDATPDTITLTSGQLTIDTDITVTGTGADRLAISGNNASRIFLVTNNGQATFNRLSLINGDATNNAGGTQTAGGAIYNDGGNLTLRNSVVRNNRGNFGGAIYNIGTMTLLNSTVSNNTATNFEGGGILNWKTLVAINNTITGNTANAEGGGISSKDGFGGSLLSINNTITGNTSNDRAGGLYSSSPATLINTLIAGNLNAISPDLDGAVAGTNNLIGVGTGSSGLIDGTDGNLIGTQSNPIDPKLNTLGNNGGSTLTAALLDDSPAINAGNNAAIPADTYDLDGDGNTTEALPVDQRGVGFGRQIGSRVDIGAIESSIINIAPTITLPGTTITYNENAVPALLDSTATVQDRDSSNLNTGTLTISFSANGSSDDRLSIRNQGNATGEIGITNNEVAFSGTVIGTFTGGTGTTPLIITFNDQSSAVATQALLRNIGYSNISDAPSTLDRTVSVVLSDGQGGTSTAINKTIQITASNDSPTGTVTIAGTPTLGQTLTASNNLNDADGLGTITYQWQADGIDIPSAVGETFVLTSAEVGKTITVKASYTDLQDSDEVVFSDPTGIITVIQITNTLSTVAGIAPQSRTNWATDLTQPGYPAGLTYVVTTDRPDLFAQLPTLTTTGELRYELKPYVNLNAVANLTVDVKRADGTIDPQLTRTSTLQVSYKPEALVRNLDNNQVGLLYIDNGTQLQAQRTLTDTNGQPITVTQDWTISDTADFDRDGIADILLHNKLGDTVEMVMMNADGKVRSRQALTQNGTTLKTGNTNWNVAGFADINQDGTLDIVWHNPIDDGVGFWFMNTDGQSVNSYDYLYDSDGSILRTRNNWQMTDVADFDGDGDADLLFRLPELNQTAIIRLDGQKLVDYQFINSMPTPTATIKGVSEAMPNRPATIYWQTPDNQQVFVQSIGFAANRWVSDQFTQSQSSTPVVGIGDIDRNNIADALTKNGLNGLRFVLNDANNTLTPATDVQTGGTSFQFAPGNWQVAQLDEFGDASAL